MALTFGSSDKTRSAEIGRKLKAGKLRKLASKLYTDDLRSKPEDIIRRARLEIAAHFYPGAVISHRSALEGTVSPAGKLHISVPGNVAPVRKLPGLEIRLWKGPEAQPGDTEIAGGDGKLGLYIASQSRAVLENFQIARARADDESKTLSAEEIEAWFDRHLSRLGSEWLEDLLSRACVLAERIEWNREYTALQEFSKAITGKASAYQLKSDLAVARASGTPYDPERLQLFAELRARLAAELFSELSSPSIEEFETRAFWEAYFSNYIEGTRFPVDEAHEIIMETDAAKAIQRKRPEDAHDILETYRLIVDPNVSGNVASSSQDYIELIKVRHARMMASRSRVNPGVFKELNNEVGSRVFVRPELVTETLSRGWTMSRSLKSATARAFFMLFVVAEVHPFQDGNGRISRLGMNAILEEGANMRLILPTSFRVDYLTVLEALTISEKMEPYVRFAHKLIELNSRMPMGSFEESHNYFKKTGALDDPGQTNFDLRPLLQ
jgi:hypothetical protein